MLEDHSFEPESLRITGPGAVEKLTVYYGYVVSGKAVDEDGMGIPTWFSASPARQTPERQSLSRLMPTAIGGHGWQAAGASSWSMVITDLNQNLKFSTYLERPPISSTLA